MRIRDCDAQHDFPSILHLYRSIALKYPGTINQEPEEITEAYVKECIHHGIKRGVVLVAEVEGKLVGYFKTYTAPFKSLAHVLGDATIMIDPAFQSRHIGTAMIKQLQNRIRTTMRHIYKVELLPHDSNIKSIELYKKLGFQITYESRRKILNPDETFGDQVLMEWINPNFEVTALYGYHEYLRQLQSLGPWGTFGQFLKNRTVVAKL